MTFKALSLCSNPNTTFNPLNLPSSLYPYLKLLDIPHLFTSPSCSCFCLSYFPLCQILFPLRPRLMLLLRCQIPTGQSLFTRIGHYPLGDHDFTFVFTSSSICCGIVEGNAACILVVVMSSPYHL